MATPTLRLNVRIDMMDCDNPDEVAACFQDDDAKRLLEEYQLEPFEIPTGFVARDMEDKIVGAVVIGFDHYDKTYIRPSLGGAKPPWIWGLRVNKEYQFSGVGKNLINACIDFIRKAGYPYVCLSTQDAHQWYVSNWGFEYSNSVLVGLELHELYWLKL